MNNINPMIVAIDTSIFVRLNHSYFHQSIMALMDQINEGRVRLVITPVIIEEVKASIVKNVSEAASAIKQLRKKAKVFRNLSKKDFANIFEEPQRDYFEEELISQFEQFLNGSNAEILPFEYSDTEYVFDLYFKGLPPFGTGKKKCEFPDCFTLSSLTWIIHKLL